MKSAKMTGGEELRDLDTLYQHTPEGFSDQFTLDQLIKIWRAQRASEWDFTPDMWTRRQVKEALKGKVPRWDDNERPVYK